MQLVVTSRAKYYKKLKPELCGAPSQYLGQMCSHSEIYFPGNDGGLPGLELEPAPVGIADGAPDADLEAHYRDLPASVQLRHRGHRQTDGPQRDVGQGVLRRRRQASKVVDVVVVEDVDVETPDVQNETRF